MNARGNTKKEFRRRDREALMYPKHATEKPRRRSKAAYANSAHYGSNQLVRLPMSQPMAGGESSSELKLADKNRKKKKKKNSS